MHSVIQVWTFLHLVNAWGLSSCTTGVYFALQKAFFSVYMLPLKCDHVHPLLQLQTLHWLPVQARTNYKLSTMFANSLTHHLLFCDILCVYTPSGQLHSSADTWILCIPHANTKTLGQPSFLYCTPKQWNFLPSDIHQIQSAHAFKTAVKTSFYKK